MAFEIERKFLVTDRGYVDMARERVEIRQGYIDRTPEHVVRVRMRGHEWFLTVKGKTRGAVRLEYEYRVPPEDGEGLLRLCQGRVVSKTRYLVDYGGHCWEVDEFHGDLAPLTVAEVELDSQDESVALPPFVGREVTGDPRYYNSNL